MTRQRLKPQSQRQLRVGEEIRHGFARAIAHGHFRDPDLQDVAVTVTDVRVSPDLRHATIFVLPFGGGDGRTLVKALRRAGSYLRSLLAHEIELRYLPDLAFELDTTFDQAAELDRLLHSPSVVRDLAGNDAISAAKETRSVKPDRSPPPQGLSDRPVSDSGDRPAMSPSGRKTK
ncbi:MAG TPA: 30S ribosome-binding factor RbfA [Alphaproteobacteria bacterium]|nr:30S ribosome-binding factor RbfA [Alphaproteobacteria bacterium]